MLKITSQSANSKEGVAAFNGMHVCVSVCVCTCGCLCLLLQEDTPTHTHVYSSAVKLMVCADEIRGK